MYSDELMKYLYSYNMPQKSEVNVDLGGKKPSGRSKDVLNTLQKFRNLYATVPVEFHHEQG